MARQHHQPDGAGIVIVSIRTGVAIAFRLAGRSFSTTWARDAGRTAVAIDTPNSPIGSTSPERVLEPRDRAFLLAVASCVFTTDYLRCRHADG